MPRRVLEGNVISDKADKTVTVAVERRYMHPIYKKYVKRTDKFAAHDENNQFRAGDRVQIIECRPMSKRKRWTVVIGDGAPKPSGSRVKTDPEAESKNPAKKAASDAKKAAKKEKAADKAAEKKTAEKKPAAKAKKGKE